MVILFLACFPATDRYLRNVSELFYLVAVEMLLEAVLISIILNSYVDKWILLSGA